MGRGRGKPKQFKQKKSITKLGGGNIPTKRDRGIASEVVAEAIKRILDPYRIGLYDDLIKRSGY